MHQLIILFLVIALSAMLATAFMYYGGPQYTTGSSKAGAATMVAQAQQINAADVLYQNDNAGAHAPDVTGLVDGDYLQSAPQMPSNIGENLEIDQATGIVYAEVANPQICEQVNAQFDLASIPTASDATPGSLEAAITMQYGCVEVGDADAGSASYHFAYR